MKDFRLSNEKPRCTILESFDGMIIVIGPNIVKSNHKEIEKAFDTFDGAKPRFLNRGKKRRSVSTLSIPRASDRGVEWVDFIEKSYWEINTSHLHGPYGLKQKEDNYHGCSIKGGT
jgi:hypothetical protein